MRRTLSSPTCPSLAAPALGRPAWAVVLLEAPAAAKVQIGGRAVDDLLAAAIACELPVIAAAATAPCATGSAEIEGVHPIARHPSHPLFYPDVATVLEAVGAEVVLVAGGQLADTTLQFCLEAAMEWPDVRLATDTVAGTAAPPADAAAFAQAAAAGVRFTGVTAVVAQLWSLPTHAAATPAAAPMLRRVA